MQREFLQEKSLNRSQDNAEKSLNIDLSAKSKLIPYSMTAGMLGLYDLYVEERDACENYRMIFTVNPVCTNVLFNAITEPVFMEGSYSAINLVETTVERGNEDIFPEGVLNQSADTNNVIFPIDQIAAVRDTEISHEKIGNFKYHCGYDIFNNHLLRTNEFEHVSLANNGSNKGQFNTIFDYAIDFSGNTVTRIINDSDGPCTSATTKENIRMYQIDTVNPISTAFYDKLRNVDGWYGFYNTGYINIQNGKLNNKPISLNHILNNETPCGFIDLYPDRSLYSFIPKVNRYKKRIERNWDCAIVYPFSSDTELFNTINDNEAAAIKVIKAKIIYNNVGDMLLQFHSLLRNTLNNGDNIRIFYKGGSDGELQRYSAPVIVVSTGNEKGDDTDRYFTIKLSDIETFCEVYEDEGGKNSLIIRGSSTEGNPTGTPVFFYYKKIESGYDNRYYFRVFKKLKNYEYIEYVSEEDEDLSRFKQINKMPTTVNKNSEPIEYDGHYFVPHTKELNYTQNKIAFAENIYGERVAQVIFNDDICISGLKDNLGRPLSTVYFMVEKTNRGHREWYEEGDSSSDTIEYSHCFGDVTSGLDLPVDDEATEYNVRKLHNIFMDDCVDYREGLEAILEDLPTGNYSGTPTPIETELNIENHDEFYGDIVEFSKVNFIETTIEKMYHRFNTAQRELLKNKNYYEIHYDDLIGDLYDVNKNDNL